MTTSSSGSIFVLGGARSGKSSFAERLVVESGLAKTYIATGRAWDDEMRARIAAHRESRGPSWQTIEEPMDLVGALEGLDGPGAAILVDCLTLWLTNLMMEAADIAAESARFVDHLSRAKARIVLVSNEVGLGIVPENAMARAFRDHAGRLHQAVAAASSEVYFVAAGLPLRMKG